MWNTNQKSCCQSEAEPNLKIKLRFYWIDSTYSSVFSSGTEKLRKKGSLCTVCKEFPSLAIVWWLSPDLNTCVTSIRASVSSLIRSPIWRKIFTFSPPAFLSFRLAFQKHIKSPSFKVWQPQQFYHIIPIKKKKNHSSTCNASQALISACEVSVTTLTS